MLKAFDKKYIIITVIAVLTILGVGVYFYMNNTSESSGDTSDLMGGIADIGSDIGQASESNPYENTNPFDYQNPFE